MILETSLKLKCLKGFRDLNGAIWRMYPVIGTYKTSLKLKCLKGVQGSQWSNLENVSSYLNIQNKKGLAKTTRVTHSSYPILFLVMFHMFEVQDNYFVIVTKSSEQ